MIRLKQLPPGFQVVSLSDEEAELDAGGFSIRGMRFGRLVAIAAVLSEKNHHKRPRYVLFQCDCGRVVKRGIVGIRRRGVPDTCGKKCRLGSLMPKKKQSRPGKVKLNHPVYGDADPTTDPRYRTTYFSWCRLRKENKMVKRWQDSFDLFIKDMGPKPPGLEICRKDRSLLHSPENSYWDHRGSDISKVHVWGHKASIGWLAERWQLPYYYIAKVSWDNGPIDMKDVIKRYNKYQERLKRKAQNQ